MRPARVWPPTLTQQHNVGTRAHPQVYVYKHYLMPVYVQCVYVLSHVHEHAQSLDMV